MKKEKIRALKSMAGIYLGLVLIGVLLGCAGKDGTTDSAKAVPVCVENAAEMEFRNEVTLYGTLESTRFAVLPARTDGTIERIVADEGDVVEEGKMLCELDSEIPRRMVEIRTEELAVATNMLEVARAQKQQARADFELAGKNLARFRHLAEKSAVSQNALDEAERNVDVSTAALDVVSAQVGLSEARVQQAITALAIAERNLRDTVVRAPIAGRVSVRHREIGEMVKHGDPVFRIDDPASLEVSVFAPERLYDEVTPEQTSTRIQVNDRDMGLHPVCYKSPTIDEQLRTFEVKAGIDNPGKDVVAGGLAVVRLLLGEHRGLGVPCSSVLVRNGKTVVFISESGKAKRVEVVTGLENNGRVEIVDGLSSGTPVIVQGQDFVSDGDPVVVVED